MVSFHSSCQEQRLLLSVFFTSSLNPVVCFDLKKNNQKSNQNKQPGTGRRGQESKLPGRKEADWKVTGLGVRSDQPLPGAAGKLPPA